MTPDRHPVAKRTGYGHGQDPRGASSASCAGLLASRCSSTHASIQDDLRSVAIRKDHQVTVSSGSRVGGCTQERASASLDSICGGANRTDPEIHRTCEETGVSRGGVRSVGTRLEVECEKELSEGEERLSRLCFEAGRPVAAIPDSVSEVQRLQQQLAEA